MSFQWLINGKMVKNKGFSLLLSDAVYILLINVKMPTTVGIFNIYEQDTFDAQLSWA